MPQASRSASRRSKRTSSKKSAANQRQRAQARSDADARPTNGTAVPSSVTTIGAGKDAKPFVQLNDLTKRSDADILPGHFCTIVGDHEFVFPDPDVTRVDTQTGEEITEKAPQRKISLIGQRAVLESVVEADDNGYPKTVRVRLGRPSSALVDVPYEDLRPASAL